LNNLLTKNKKCYS